MMYQASKQKEESHHSPPMLRLAKVHPSYSYNANNPIYPSP